MSSLFKPILKSSRSYASNFSLLDIYGIPPQSVVHLAFSCAVHNVRSEHRKVDTDSLARGRKTGHSHDIIEQEKNEEGAEMYDALGDQ